MQRVNHSCLSASIRHCLHVSLEAVRAWRYQHARLACDCLQVQTCERVVSHHVAITHRRNCRKQTCRTVRHTWADSCLNNHIKTTAFNNNKVSANGGEPNDSRDDHMQVGVCDLLFNTHMEITPLRHSVHRVQYIIFIPCWIRDLNLYQAYKKVTFI